MSSLKTYRQGVLAFSLFFGIFYASIGVMMPFLNIHFRSLGFSGVQISSFLVTGLIIQILVAPRAAYLFDRSRHKRLILTLGALALALSMAFLPVFIQYLPILLLYVFNYAIGMILASAVVNLSYQAGSHPSGGRNRFGSMRLWGSVGFALMAFVGGLLMERKGIIANDMIYVTAQVLLTGILFWLFPKKSFEEEETETQAMDFKGVLKLIMDNRYLWMTVLALAMTDTLNDGVRAFEAVYLKDLGVSTALVGLVSTLTALLEIPTLFWGSGLLEKLGTNKLAMTVIGFDLLRRFIAWLFPVPGVVMAVSALNGVSFPLRLLVTIHLVNQFIPKRFTTTANSFISVALYAAGYIFSNTVCGIIYDTLGPRQNYLFWSFLALASLLLAFAAGKPGKTKPLSGTADQAG